jgi:Ca2+-binding RTX toxin-like protein
MVLTGAAALYGTGNTLANSITGNGAANVLNGGLGNDLLAGGAGADIFVVSTAIGAMNIDRITDFNVAADTIRLDNAVMAGLGVALGTLGAGKFWKSATGLAHDADDRIIYETDTGKLFYDSNGSAKGGATHFATLSANLALTHADFVVI